MINWALKPLTDKPKKLGKSIAEATDSPRMPNETLKGTPLEGYGDIANKLLAQARGAIGGGVEGLGNLASDMTSPLSLATMALGPLGRMVGKGAQGVAKGIGPTMDLIEEAPGAMKQVLPSMDDVSSLIGDMQRNLARVPKATGNTTRGISPSMLPPEFAALGDEASHNIGRVSRMADFGSSLDDIAEAGSKVAGKVRMPTGNIDVASEMARLARARGR